MPLCEAQVPGLASAASQDGTRSVPVKQLRYAGQFPNCTDEATVAWDRHYEKESIAAVKRDLKTVCKTNVATKLIYDMSFVFKKKPIVGHVSAALQLVQ